MKALVTIALAAGAVLVVRRQRDARPTADVWRDATRSPAPAPRPAGT